MSDKLFRTNVFGGYNKEDVQTYIASLEAELVRLQEQNAVQESHAESEEKEEKAEADVIVLNDILEETGSETNNQEPEASVAGESSPVNDENEKEFEKTTQELEKAQQELEETQQELEQLKLELNDMKSELNVSRRLCEQSRMRLEFVSAEKERLEDETEELREKQKNYEKDYDAIKEVLLNARIDAEIIRTKAKKEAELLLEDTQKRIMEQKKESIEELMRHLIENRDGLHASKTYLKEQVNNLERTEKQIEVLQSRIEDFMEEELFDEEGEKHE